MPDGACSQSSRSSSTSRRSPRRASPKPGRQRCRAHRIMLRDSDSILTSPFLRVLTSCIGRLNQGDKSPFDVDRRRFHAVKVGQPRSSSCRESPVRVGETAANPSPESLLSSASLLPPCPPRRGPARRPLPASSASRSAAAARFSSFRTSCSRRGAPGGALLRAARGRELVAWRRAPRRQPRQRLEPGRLELLGQRPARSAFRPSAVCAPEASVSETRSSVAAVAGPARVLQQALARWTRSRTSWRSCCCASRSAQAEPFRRAPASGASRRSSGARRASCAHGARAGSRPRRGPTASRASDLLRAQLLCQRVPRCSELVQGSA